MSGVLALGGVRIGELSRRVGVSDHVLRAWETRYGLLSPRRSSGGYRLYSPSDEWRVRRMRHHLGRGLSAAEAAEVALSEAVAEPETVGPPTATSGYASAEGFIASLRAALDDYDEPSAQAVFDRMLAELSLAAMLRDVVLPYLRQLGERWESGEITVSQEHYASHVVRGRLAGLARGWGTGSGRRALLACPPGELHDLPLMIFGIVLNRNGWRVDYFGADTPVAELIAAVRRTGPDLVVMASTVTRHYEGIVAELADLANQAPLALAGAGATPAIAGSVGARLIDDDPVSAAETL